MSDDKRHPGITMHKFSVGSGFAGLVFTVGSALIFLFGLPQLWYFLAFSAALGVGIAAVFHLIGDSRSGKSKPLSILSAEGAAKTRTAPERSESPSDNHQKILPASFPVAMNAG